MIIATLNSPARHDTGQKEDKMNWIVIDITDVEHVEDGDEVSGKFRDRRDALNLKWELEEQNPDRIYELIKS